jgi:hypothetical protein
MIGHMKVITQIKYMYQLRQLLYAYNAWLDYIDYQFLIFQFLSPSI